ncbi:YjjG family noncanonical pyrimidine nucleotidase [Aquirufa antheringensis]|jgi:YjjG family noncanonical pyrimidine nucleotidase|uniref:Noncanonical pyrimidine nucleotidase, YjjG family n=1 Tax=Aquirufa antheringensis TaxID=2516559 RepID=A0A4Q9BIN5_9BACT|nr:YjjG family noncanonical pyrimidine nucleotidase [Aquirufa antheringensis]MCZ2485242.1 noncanonical pyrimidine nucleotidase, YjjG family [Aquirufa antheringensis]MCZ2487427.1 noncanonical pyrimidine nucleotidase, YjjG family [Aquirufa antheringensis]MCZ2490391.1 noncanonical pyrimidine nucleotidase, YjjG family [Aquirufa antheringensis]TBH75543.1 noncanonical pyrimidine nucleotidase, YjjG family [Aquirufa antheringensis]
MNFSPKALFFDWDHTLWDHDLNAKEVLLDLAVEYELAIEPLSYWATFEKINNGLWDQYAAGEISQAELRETRFVRFFQELRVEGPAEEFGDKYLERAPRKTNLMPGAFEVIQDLAAHFPLYILTNGFDDIQYVKIEGAGMRSFFQEIITSQQVGTKKPNPLFYEYALERAGIQPGEALMIGDHVEADVRGALNAGIPAIHYNPFSVETDLPHEIQHLDELRSLLKNR